MNNLKLEIGTQAGLRAASCYIRMTVFVLERGIALMDEFDEHDLPQTTYSVIFDGKSPVATARLLPLTPTSTRITRVATLKEYRGKSLGKQVVAALEKIAWEQGFQDILIHAEVTAAEFYKKIGYQAISDIYEEDGVPCLTFQKKRN